MAQYKFTPHITPATHPFAERLANKYGLTLDSSGMLALYFLIGANVKDGKGEQFVEEFISMDMMSDEFKQKNKNLESQEDFRTLVQNLERAYEQGQAEAGKIQTRKKKSKKSKRR